MIDDGSPTSRVCVAATSKRPVSRAARAAGSTLTEYGSTPGSAGRLRQLAEARRGSWLGQGSSTVQQQALRDFDRALKNWWGGSHRRPRWRQAGIDEGFCGRDVTVIRLNRRWATISVAKLGPVRFRLSRPLPEAFGMARITRDRAGRWPVSFTAPQPVLERTTTGRSIGLDAGVVATLTGSNGLRRHAPGSELTLATACVG
jgi:putative transposase